MSSIVAISGTPKAKGSASGSMIRHIAKALGEPVTTYQATRLVRSKDPGQELADILRAEVILFVFPLYVDALPAPLIRVLTLLEKAMRTDMTNPPRVYAVCQCGFFEAEHNRLALDIVANFCARTGLDWRYGVGVGGGAYAGSQANHPTSGPTAVVFTALDDLAQAIRTGDTPTDNVFVTPRMPRLLYQLAANWSWRPMAKPYNAQRNLRAQPYADVRNAGR